MDIRNFSLLLLALLLTPAFSYTLINENGISGKYGVFTYEVLLTSLASCDYVGTFANGSMMCSPTPSFNGTDYYNKTEADERFQTIGNYLTEELDPVCSEAGYITAAALADFMTNSTIAPYALNATFAGYMTNGSMANYMTNTSTNTQLGLRVLNSTLAGYMTNGSFNSILANYQVNGTDAASGGATVPAYKSNNTYFSISTEFELLPAAYNRQTTTPTANTTSGVGTAMNFPTAASAGGDGGYFCMGSATTTVTTPAGFTALNITYMGAQARFPLTTSRRDLFGVVKTGTSPRMNDTMTGVFFSRGVNVTADTSYWYANVCNANVCTTQNTTFNSDQTWQLFEIIPNSTHWNFYINATLRAAVIRTNQPTTPVAFGGWWSEATTGTARVTVLNWMDCEGWRGSIN